MATSDPRYYARSASDASSPPAQGVEPATITSRELIKRCGGDPDEPLGRISFPPEDREPSPELAPVRVTGEAAANIVPAHASGVAFVFEPGVLHVNKDGSGHIAIDEDDFACEDDRCEGPDGPEGSVHWIARLPAGEMQSLRDFLNGAKFHASPPPTRWGEALGLLKEARDLISEERQVLFEGHQVNGEVVVDDPVDQQAVDAIKAMDDWLLRASRILKGGDHG